MSKMFQLEIPKRAAQCCLGGESFAPGEEYHSVLVGNDETGEYERRDYCFACWEKMGEGKEHSRPAGAWRACVPKQKEPSDLPKQRDERAFYLLREALEKDGPEEKAEAFVLALFLARRRLIILRQEMQHQTRGAVSLYEAAETEEMICVPKLSLSDLQVEKLQLQLAAKFRPTTAS